MAEFLLGENDDGSLKELCVGDRVTIALAANATAGYRWEVVHEAPEFLQGGRIDPVPAADGNIGGSAMHRFCYRAVHPGDATLELKLWRSWEGDRSIRRRFGVHLRIRTGAAPR